jgi:tetratricopeptide (TPR) repeat protein
MRSLYTTCAAAAFSLILLAGPDTRAQISGTAAESSPAAAKQFRFAEGLLARNFHDLAAAEFEKFLEQYPDHPDAPRAGLCLVKCFEADDRPEAALRAAATFLGRWPEHEVAGRLRLIQGDILLRTGQPAQAAVSFQALTANSDPAIGEAAQYFLAQSLVQQQRVTDAIAVYEKLALEPFEAERPYRPYAAFALATVLQKQGASERADRFYALLTAERNGVPPALQEESLYRRGENAFQQKRYDNAISFYTQLLAKFEGGTFARQARKRRIWVYVMTRDYAQATSLAAAWRKRYPDAADPEMDYIQGIALMGAESFQAALTFFAGILNHADTTAQYRRLAAYQQVYCLLRLQRQREAVTAASRFLESYPGAPQVADVYYFQASALIALKDNENAIPTLHKALDAAPTDWKHAFDSKLKLARLLAETEQYSAAASVYRKLASTASDVEAAYFLATASDWEVRAGNTAIAIADLRNLLPALDPASEAAGKTALKLAALQSEAGDYQAARKTVEPFLDASPATLRAQFFFILGYTFYREENYAAAEAQFRKTLAVEGQDRRRAEALHFLIISLLEQQKTADAMEIFPQLLHLPAAERPELSDQLLLRLQDLYFNRNQYELSAEICQKLIGSSDREAAHQATLRLARIMIARNQVAEARKQLIALQKEILANQLSPAANEDVMAQQEKLAALESLLGETYLITGDNDQAVRAFIKALAGGQADVLAGARANWGMATVLKAEGRLEEALNHAVKAFVLADVPLYTPRAMLLAIEILQALERNNEARTTWQELQKRYPVFAEQSRTNAVIKTLDGMEDE